MAKKINDKVLKEMLTGVHFEEADMAGQIKAREMVKAKPGRKMKKSQKDEVVAALDGLIAGLKAKLEEIGEKEVAPGVTTKMYAFMGHSCDTDESPMEGEVGFVAPKKKGGKTKLSIRLKKNTPVGVMVQAVLSGMAGFIKDAGREHGLELTDQEIRGAMHYVVDKMDIDEGKLRD